MKRCNEYCGVACVDGSCPIANREEYAERGYYSIDSCDDCNFYKGCKDCAFEDTAYCPKFNNNDFKEV